MIAEGSRASDRLRPARLECMSLAEIIDPGWAHELEPVADAIHAMGDFLREENAAGRRYLPAGANVLRAFTYPFDAVRPIPRSLVNIYRELHDDLGLTPPDSGDLTPWCDQGVMLLNRVLTVEPGKPASHRGKGWEAITGHAIRRLASRGGPLVAILWGRPAQELKPLLAGVPTIESPHPSPLSASRGFFGSRPFSRANALLSERGGGPVDWSLA